jgi:hypothetical protein
MYRLGAQLTLRSGREPLVRLVVTAVAVAAGVAIILAVLADFNAFSTTSNRPAWENTQGYALTASYRSATHAELWNYGNDIYQGQTIERLDVAGLGPSAPVPPGISRLPGPGQYYASPALAALIRSVPADELGDRFPGRLIGTIGQRALTGPTELVAYVGYAPATLAARPATTLVSKINNAAAGTASASTPYFRGLFIVAAIMFLFPILILVATATRLAAARREERYAALRLVGATARQIATISSVEAAISGLIGTLGGIGLFAALQPLLADSAITSARYFADEVTPTALGYLLVVVGVPVASAIGALLALRRVRISPLGVTRRVTPPPPTAWRIAPLAVGIVLFSLGLVSTNTNRQRVSPFLLAGLIVIMLGVVVAGPWLTAQSARLLGRLASGPAPLLAARRLADNPKLAFRAVSGLVLAVFLGTAVGSALPAIEYTTATPRESALSNVLMDGFTSAPVCGNGTSCIDNGQGTGTPRNALAGSRAAQQRIDNEGLPPQDAARLLAGLDAIIGATVIPIYSPKGSVANSANGSPGGGIISCAGLRELAVLGQCAPGRSAVVAQPDSMFADNPRYASQPIAYAKTGWIHVQNGLPAPPGHGVLETPSPAASANFTGLYLQDVLVKVNNAATLEKVRTYLITHTPESASGTAPRTFGEALLPRAAIAATVQRLIDIAVILTLIVAGCSLAVSVGGSLVERKRPFTLLRVAGTQIATLYRVVLLEAALPLVAATILAGAVAYFVATTTVKAIEPGGTPVLPPAGVYYATMAAGLAGALLVILTSLPLLRRLTAAAGVRFE